MREGWKQVTIGDLGQVITGNTPPRKQPELYGNHTLFVKPTDMEVDKKYCYNPEEKYSEKGFIKYKKSIIPKGSTCVVTIGSIGQKMIKAHKELFINQAVNAVVPNNLYDEDFVYYLLKLNLFQLKTFDSGTASGRENVSKSSFSNIKLVVPASKEKQHKIGSILSTYDDLIENNLKRIKLLEEKAQLTYEEWFVKMRFPGYETAKFDEVTGLPEGWEKEALENIVEMKFGFAFKANLFNSEGRGRPIIRIRNIPKSMTNDFTTETASEKYLVKKGDLLIGMDGEFYINTWTGPDSYLVQRVCNLVCKEETLKGYLTEAIKHPIKIFQASIDGATVAHLGKKHLDQIEITVPNFNIEIFNSLLNQRIVLANQNRLLKEARDILLPRLMSGMIDVDELQVKILNTAK